MLSPESSAEPGRWFTSRAEYQRGLMDAIGDPETESVVAMLAAQTGKTSLVENVIGYHIDQDPAPILMVVPTLELAESFSKDRLAPMIRDTAAIGRRIGDPRARDGDNTVLHKKFAGGHVTLAGANSPASLSSRPIRVLLCDEVDRFPPSAGTEGDPVSLAKKRTQTFWNHKHVLISTPTIKGFSRIEQAFEESDKRRFWVPCPHCAVEQTLVWRQVRWPEGRPEEAAYHCESCGAAWTDQQRWAVVAMGTWRAEAPFRGTAGFHLNGIYSPWVRLGDAAREFIAAKPHPERLKVWVNTFLAETFEEDAERADADSFAARLEDWGPAGPVGPLLAPPGVLVVTCGVDVQDDRLEIERVGWGVDEESWSLHHHVIYGDPSTKELWQELDDYLLTPTRVSDEAASAPLFARSGGLGWDLPVSAACIDSGGHYTQAVYRFCLGRDATGRSRYGRRVYAIKGVSSNVGDRKPVWSKRPSKNNKQRAPLFLVGVDAAKDALFQYFKLREAGPGYCHFPAEREAGYFKQLTAERVRTQYVRGFPRRVYFKDPSQRNEALDLRVYAYAALAALNVNWTRLAQAQRGPLTPTPPAGGRGADLEAEVVPMRDLPRPMPQLDAPGGAAVPAASGRRRVAIRSSFLRR